MPINKKCYTIQKVVLGKIFIFGCSFLSSSLIFHGQLFFKQLEVCMCAFARWLSQLLEAQKCNFVKLDQEPGEVST